MPADPSTANSMLFSSDYPLDKIVYERATSVSIPAGINTTSFAHGLPFTPLVFGNWSTDSSFNTAYNFNSGSLPGAPGYLFGVEIDISADSTNIYLTLINSGSSTTAYYRIYAFEPSDSASDVDYTSSALDEFIVNTDYRYTKLYSAGTTSVPNATPITISHNLGFIPQVMAWYRDKNNGNRFVPKFYGGYFGTGDIEILELEVTTTSLIITRDTIDDSADRVDYRIYADEI